MTSFRWLLPLLLPVILGCDASPTTVELRQRFVLAPGQSAVVGSGGPRVTFERVLEDSRCPSDAICVWIGEVVVEVTIAGASPSSVSLRPGESTSWRGFRVRLVEVQPYPSTSGPIEPSQYRASFLVEPTERESRG